MAAVPSAGRTTGPKDGVDHDVLVIGSGLAGSITAACLARNGIDVPVLDAAKHPRLAIGESTIPFTSMMMRLVTERYGVTEIQWHTTVQTVHKNVPCNPRRQRNVAF